MSKKNADTRLMQAKLDPNTPEVAAYPRYIIHDPEFNLVRRGTVPVKQDGTPDTLQGAAGPDSIVNDIMYPLVLRRATEEEKARWLELHSKDEWFASLSDEDKVKHTPYLIPADGFGRLEEHIRINSTDKQSGIDVPITAKLLDTDDPLLGASVGMHLNNHCRRVHHMDLFSMFKTLKKERGFKHADLARQFGILPQTVTQVMKISALTEAELQRAVKENWSLNRIVQVVDKKNQTAAEGGSKTTPATKKPKKKLVEDLIWRVLPSLLSDDDAPDIGDFDLPKINKEFSKFLNAFRLGIEWMSGIWESGGEPVDPMDVFVSNELIGEDISFRFQDLAKEVNKALKKKKRTKSAKK